MGRNTSCFKQKLRKGLWSPEEDDKLLNHITKHGHGCWSSVPKLAGLQRCGKSCRLRWINYLRPDLKRGAFSQPEEDLIIQLHAELGNRWSQIAARLPGRTDNEIKNLWNSSIKKRLREKGIDPNTHKPLSPTSRAPTSSPDDDDDGVPPKPDRPMWRNTSPRFSADYDTGLPLPFQHTGSKLFDAGDSGSISSVLPPTFTSILPTSPSLGVMASHLQENMESARACCGNALVGSGYWESGTSSSGSASGSGSGTTGTGGGGGSTSSSLEPQASATAAAAASFLQTTELPWQRELVENLIIDDDEMDEFKWSEFLQSATMGVPSIPPPPTFHHQSNYITPEAKTAAAQFGFDELSSWQQLGRPTLLPPSPLRQENQSQNQMMPSSDKDFQRISSASFGHV